MDQSFYSLIISVCLCILWNTNNSLAGALQAVKGHKARELDDDMYPKEMARRNVVAIESVLPVG